MPENIKADKVRIEYIDLFRSFGIILMILGHIRFGSIFDKWIHAFHMPMFYFVSGWFFRSHQDQSISMQIRRKAKSLLMPYVLFELLLWIILRMFIPEYRSLESLAYIFTENTYKIPVASGTFGISPVPGAMWFLTSIFVCESVYIIIDKKLKTVWLKNGIVILLVITGMMAKSIFPFRLPWAMDAAFVGVGFFHAGRSMRGNAGEKLLALDLSVALMAGLVVSCLIIITPLINMRTGNYGWYIPFWINAIGAIIAGWSLSKYLQTFLERYAVNIAKWLNGIGKNSIVYLCLNQSIILMVTKLLSIAGVHGIIAKIPVFFITMAILYMFEKLICNTRLKVILGK